MIMHRPNKFLFVKQIIFVNPLRNVLGKVGRICIILMLGRKGLLQHVQILSTMLAETETEKPY